MKTCSFLRIREWLRDYDFLFLPSPLPGKHLDLPIKLLPRLICYTLTQCHTLAVTDRQQRNNNNNTIPPHLVCSCVHKNRFDRGEERTCLLVYVHPTAQTWLVRWTQWVTFRSGFGVVCSPVALFVPHLAMTRNNNNAFILRVRHIGI